MPHVDRTGHLLACEECLVQFFAVSGSNNSDLIVCVEYLFDGLG